MQSDNIKDNITMSIEFISKPDFRGKIGAKPIFKLREAYKP